MDKVIKIILSILAALALFMAGWVAKAWESRNKVTKEVKQAIADLNEQHEKALIALKDEYNTKLKKKDEIIIDLKKTIDRLIRLFESIEDPGVATVIRNLKNNKEKLCRL